MDVFVDFCPNKDETNMKYIQKEQENIINYPDIKADEHTALSFSWELSISVTHN